MDKRILIWGDDGVAEHVIAQLHAAGHKLVVFSESKKDRIGRAATKATGTKLIIGSPLDQDDLAKVNLSEISAIALLRDDDADVLSAGLTLSEAAPGVPLLMRMFVTEIASGITKLTDAVVLSASEISAPVIVGMAVDPAYEPLTATQTRAILTGSVIPRLNTMQRRATAAFMLLGTLLTVNTLVDHHVLKMTWVDALVATAKMCFGDIAVDDAPDAIKLLSVFTLVIGGLSVLLFFSAAQHHVAHRLSVSREKPVPRSNHIVIFGGGKTGLRVVEALHALGIALVVVDTDEQAAVRSFCRANDIAFRLGSAKDADLMDLLHVKTARAVLALTNSDVVNLECALLARNARPGVRVVVRSFDPVTAERLDTDVNMYRTVSVSGRAAPSFTAKLVEMVTPIPTPTPPPAPVPAAAS